MDQEMWGKLETKVRRFVFDLIEPSVNRIEDHKEMLENLRRTDDQLSKRLDNLETVTERITKKLSSVDDLSRKVSQFDATIQVQETIFTHDREAIKDQLEAFLKQLTNTEENVSLLQGQTQDLRTELINLNFETDNTKQLLSNRIESVKDELIVLIQALDLKQSDLSNYYNVLDKKFTKFVIDFEEVDVIAKKIERYSDDSMVQLKTLIKNFNNFKKESKDSIDKVRQMSIQFSQTLTDSIKEAKEKFRIETPIFNQLQISDALHCVLDLKPKKLLAEFETSKYAEWELETVPSHMEYKIDYARRRTQNVIDLPLPIEEVKPVLVVSKDKVIGTPEVTKRMANVKFEEQGNVYHSYEPKDDYERGNSAHADAEEASENGSEKIESIRGRSSHSNRDISLEDLEKNSEAIAKMIGIKDFTEDIHQITEAIKKIQEENKDTTKRLQTTEKLLEEKIQSILKKQYDTSLKIEELKTSQQMVSDKSESDKKELSNTISAIGQKVTIESKIMSSKFEELSTEFFEASYRVNASVTTITEGFKAFSESLSSSMKSQNEKLSEFYDTISKKNEVLDFQIQQAAFECNAAVTQRKRDHCDNQAEFKKMHGMFDAYNKKVEGFNQNFDNLNRSLQLLLELCRITYTLQYQDEIDRESIALFGVKDSKHGSNRLVSLSKPSISIDKQCLSCSGQPNFVTSAYKIACLAYSPTSIVFKNTVYERFELLDIQKRIIEGMTDEIIIDFLGAYDKQTHSMKLNQWRPSSRMSSLSVSQHMVSGTPDLPPLTFSKRVNY
jgi:chromosome segregation ATPase